MKLSKALRNEQNWINLITNLKTKRGNLETSLLNAIKKRLPKQKFGIMFSGGIDSTMIAYICKKLKADFTCYAVGIENSTDLEYAKNAAKQLNLKLKYKQYTLKQSKDIIKQVINITNNNDIVTAGVGAVVYACMQLAKKDGINVLFSGLGSEEIFAGYERHKVSDINKECWSGLKAMWKRDFQRDIKIAESEGFKVLTPFLDTNLIQTAMAIPGKEKISKNYKKLPLRKLAESMKLPKSLAWRKKQAAQYGSKFDRAILKLTKKAGFKFKKDYLNSQFNLGALFSSGKDSTYALYKMQQQNYNVNCLITIISKNTESYMFHTPNIDLTKYQAEALELPLIQAETKGIKEKELEDLENLLKKAKKKYKLNGIITGALFSNYQRDRINNICEKLGLKCFSPLWHMDQETEMQELVKEGFKFIFTAIAGEGLTKEDLGKIIDDKLIQKLIKINQKIGTNIAGEGGEFESLVLDAPNFNKKLVIKKEKIVMENECTGILQIEKVELTPNK